MAMVEPKVKLRNQGTFMQRGNHAKNHKALAQLLLYNLGRIIKL